MRGHVTFVSMVYGVDLDAHSRSWFNFASPLTVVRSWQCDKSHSLANRSFARTHFTQHKRRAASDKLRTYWRAYSIRRGQVKHLKLLVTVSLKFPSVNDSSECKLLLFTVFGSPGNDVDGRAGVKRHFVHSHQLI